MKITIFGAGYVGLVTGACLSEHGNDVVCVDVNEARVKSLNQGQCPIHEPGLPEMITNNLKAGRLRFTTSAKEGIAHGFYQFIAVGTPSDENGSADLQYVLAVAKSLGEFMDAYRVVITKSTVPVGTADKVHHVISQGLHKRKLNCSFDMVSNPEFLREGAAIEDFMKSDRIIIGSNTEKAAQHMAALYAPFNRNHDRLISMDIRSAELTKYAANAMLATKISFMNEMSQLAELLDADVEKVRIGIGSDPRIGYHFINPGCGYGGSCFPKDVMALQTMAQELHYDVQLISAVHEVNQKQKQVLFNKIAHYFKNDLKDKVIALWGLSFKPNTDDMREASSRTLMELLWEKGAKVQAYDPVAMPEAQRIYGNHPQLKFCDSLTTVLQGADALAIVTEWKVFQSPDFSLIKNKLRYPVIFDGRNLYDPNYVQSLGFDYFGIGRGKNTRSVTHKENTLETEN